MTLEKLIAKLAPGTSWWGLSNAISVDDLRDGLNDALTRIQKLEKSNAAQVKETALNKPPAGA